MLSKHSNKITLILVWVLRLSAFCVFFGRGWEHLITDAPFRAILWDQSLMEGVISTLTGLSWNEYVSSATYNFIIDASIKITGLFYILCAVVSLFISAKHKRLSKLLVAGSLLLITLSLLFYKNKFLQFGQLIEYSCQMLSPLFLYVILFHKAYLPKLYYVLKIAIALTFAGHGLYALGVYPTPGIWTDMALGSLNFIGLYPSIHQVQHIIYLAGILDMVLAVGIFLPNKWSTPFLIWAFIWGLLTALSRVIGFMQMDASWHTLVQWLPQTIMRLPHALIPLAVLVFIYKDWDKFIRVIDAVLVSTISSCSQRKTEASELAPIAAVSFLCSVDVEAVQKDLAESGTTVKTSHKRFASKNFLLFRQTYNNSLLANFNQTQFS